MLATATTSISCKPEKPAATERAREARARLTTAKTKESEAARQSTYESSLTDAERAVVVAKVGDVEITLGYVERYLSQQPAFVRARYRTFDQKVELLNNLIRFEILAAEADKAGWSADPDVVMAVKRAMVQKYLATDMQQLVVASEISDEEVQTFYKNNLSTFITPTRVRAMAIMSDSEAQARTVYTELTAAIKADPSRQRVIFRDFARARSVDKDSAWRSGDLGLFAEDGYVVGDTDGKRIPAAVVQAAFALSLNGLSEPVEADGKWWVLQITNRKRGTERKLDDVRREVTRHLLRKKQDDARDAFIKKLRTEADVTVNQELLQTLRVDAIRSATPDSSDILPKTRAAAQAATPSSGGATESPAGPAGSQGKATKKDAAVKRTLARPRAHLNPTVMPRTLAPAAKMRKQGAKPSQEEIEALYQRKSEGK